MNNQITEDDISNLKHMLGATKPRPKRNWGFRNYFCAGKSGSDFESMLRLEAAQLVTRGREDEHHIYFHCTKAGCEKAGLDEKQTARAFED